MNLVRGDLVLLRSYHKSNAIIGKIAKFYEIWKRPYKVKSKLGDLTHLVVHVCDEKLERGIFNISY